MFSANNKIIKIDVSDLDCSQIISCKDMFSNCSSVKKINIGFLDFSSCTNFERMFSDCHNLLDLDVSHLNTQNNLSFNYMFNNCNKLTKIDVSKFNSNKCETMAGMFNYCSNITEINMLNWDMGNIKPRAIKKKDFINIGSPFLFLPNNIPESDKNKDFENLGIEYLFSNCQKLKDIKMNINFNKIEELIEDSNNIIPSYFSPNKIRKKNTIFEKISENGSFTYKKGANSEIFLGLLPSNWNKSEKKDTIIGIPITGMFNWKNIMKNNNNY